MVIGISGCLPHEFKNNTANNKQIILFMMLKNSTANVRKKFGMHEKNLFFSWQPHQNYCCHNKKMLIFVV